MVTDSTDPSDKKSDPIPADDSQNSDEIKTAKPDGGESRGQEPDDVIIKSETSTADATQVTKVSNAKETNRQDNEEIEESWHEVSVAYPTLLIADVNKLTGTKMTVNRFVKTI